MPFSRPTLTEIVERIETDIETRITDIGSLARRSVLKVIARVLGGAIHLVYGFLNYIADQLFISTSDGQYLDTHGEEYGINRNAATYAVGTGTATGTNGTEIPAGTELQSSSGNIYSTDTLATIASGTATLSFTASAAGDDSNEDGGVIISFVSPISGVNTDVTVSSDGIYNGSDEETDDAYRERLLTRKRRPPHGGASSDYVAWAKEISGVTRAWCFSQYMGVGTLALAFVRDGNSTITPTSTQIDEMEEYIIEHTDPGSGETVGIPVTAEAGFSVLTLTEVPVNFTIELYPNTTAVQTSVEEELENLLLDSGGPGQTIYTSQIDNAISQAVGEERHNLVTPSGGISSSYTEVPVMGTITFTTMS